jgi:hypothetical protein
MKPACPVGKHAYSGGLDTSAGFEEVEINTLAPATVQGTPGGAWSARPDLVGASPRNFTSYVVCGPKLN